MRCMEEKAGERLKGRRSKNDEKINFNAQVEEKATALIYGLRKKMSLKIWRLKGHSVNAILVWYIVGFDVVNNAA